MYYVKVDTDSFHDALGMMKELWSGAYCLNNPQETIEQELLALNEIYAIGTVNYVAA